ncbi:uncharacterized protein AMSG_06273 [Thecamonas trahens ATCC 50062]|uniref:Guanylate cyclase domain-containing protein n=1 Tax=Thecamonas trahens ATCC 50062 TaxID=461836 RepID=A0A0L0DC98_THETB|nr:hypothetical protein AMSG_06273 [Thecamonas trahens ATCC 50062]KNC49962.1 hypothetical protein AMSG_06273 [Thecamonas trahens ATCC 50062]|eukprot:XP_013757436.1 hypothetical protein AMSG_06273 [Thecamonas trahens ATCC 50062]
MRTAITATGGYEFKTEGDAFFSPAASAPSSTLMAVAWPNWLVSVLPSGDPAVWNGVRVRMGIHYGQVSSAFDVRAGRTQYFGSMVNLATLVSDTGTGGQIVTSREVIDQLAAARSRLDLDDAHDNAAFAPAEVTVTPLANVAFDGMSASCEVWEIMPTTLANRAYDMGLDRINKIAASATLLDVAPPSPLVLGLPMTSRNAEAEILTESEQPSEAEPQAEQRACSTRGQRRHAPTAHSVMQAAQARSQSISEAYSIPNVSQLTREASLSPSRLSPVVSDSTLSPSRRSPSPTVRMRARDSSRDGNFTLVTAVSDAGLAAPSRPPPLVGNLASSSPDLFPRDNLDAPLSPSSRAASRRHRRRRRRKPSRAPKLTAHPPGIALVIDAHNSEGSLDYPPITAADFLCTYTFDFTHGGIELVFNAFNTEVDYDYMYIYEGTTTPDVSKLVVKLSDMTLEAKVNLDNTALTSRVDVLYYRSASTEFAMRVAGDDIFDQPGNSWEAYRTIAFQATTGYAWYESEAPTGSIDIATDVHLSGAFDSTTDEWSIYLDGVLKDSRIIQESNADFRMSQDDPGLHMGHFRVKWDQTDRVWDVRIWNYSRSAAEIAADVNTALTGCETGLVGLFRLQGSDNSNQAGVGCGGSVAGQCAPCTTCAHPNGMDCAGTCDGNAILDACNVCSGGTTNRQPNADRDDCGVCFGGNADRDDCGGAHFDACGVCGGNATVCYVGCDGVYGSSIHYDCHGVCGGNATIDSCGMCAGGNVSTPLPYNYHLDSCGVCFGQDLTCTTCASGVLDACGVCDGDNSTCVGCDGIRVSDGGALFDLCGVCGGDGSSCIMGCDGVLGSSATYDCTGTCSGTAAIDECNSCTGGTSLIPTANFFRDDCGICFRGNVDRDSCGVCFGGDADRDDCGVCRGHNAAMDDCGACFGSNLAKDDCGTCYGNNTVCAGCDGIPNSGKTLKSCGMCSAADVECPPNTKTTEGGVSIVTVAAMSGALLVLCLVLIAAIVLLYRSRRSASVSAYHAALADKAPQGEIFIVTTDIQDSTALWEANPEQMILVLDKHNEIMRAAIAATGGYEFKTEGDAFFVAYEDVEAMISFTCGVQRALMDVSWPNWLLSLMAEGRPAGLAQPCEIWEMLPADLASRSLCFTDDRMRRIARSATLLPGDVFASVWPDEDATPSDIVAAPALANRMTTKQALSSLGKSTTNTFPMANSLATSSPPNTAADPPSGVALVEALVRHSIEGTSPSERLANSRGRSPSGTRLSRPRSISLRSTEYHN